MHLSFLLESTPETIGPVCALFGDDDYLKREVLNRLRNGTPCEEYVGREAEWRDVHDALTAISLFGDDADVVVVLDADKFVSDYRDKLEAWVSDPQGSRTLVLDVKTWPGNTRLAKATTKAGLAIDCGVPVDNKNKRLTKFMGCAKKWLTNRAADVHLAKLERAACDRLFDLLPLSMGIIDQEVAKLSLLADEKKIDVALVEAHVGDWRTRQTWDMIDAMVEGRAAEAMRQLDRLLAAGEHPIAVMGQVSYTLRNFAKAAQLVEQTEAEGRRVSLPHILSQCGFWQSKVDAAVTQLRKISRDRARQLSTWLVDVDLAMKGHNSADARARLEIERLIARLSQAASSAAMARS